ncbi:MarR family winged helix-turn-helix transcriptional regulator [Jeotgalibaca ciconiae]|uniref:MarR family transcriptional regulator n=1 Tax=Jeotgalibaca ciconiae TaxID=2496265 RepID=A0A3Q9BLJ3_9LACT|nr:MarR family transcriptional regulator [Jeotgalibaca ciconiae]AZP04737.1 MarR family transcriptional regulator [Jeotgalibaca ciconiae]HJB23595.1 MarR family transcriptional regulator [Candidatus Jeotgalibaca pullicola]
MTNEELCRNLWQLLKSIHEAKEWVFSPFSREFGITPLQLQALIEIHANHEMALNQLASALDMNSGNTSTMCKKLEQEGFVIRQRREDDERYISLFLTDKGNSTLTILDERLEKNYQPIFSEIKEETLLDFHKGVKALQQIVELIDAQKRED